VLKEIRTYTEYAAAKGGLMFKPYISSDGLAIDAVHADMFYPVAFDSNGNMTSCVFADQKTIGGYYFTRLESHVFSNGVYRINNTAWKSSVRDELGTQIPLTEVSDWKDLLPDATITNIKRPLFAYFKMPFANNIDPRSPLGVSVYARAAQGDNSLLRQADQMWTDLLWEFESGKRAVYTTPDAFGKDADGKAILPDRRLYRLLDLAAVQLDKPGFFHDWTPTLREVNILNGLDAVLRRIEFNCGLSYGVLSNPEAVALTATEIKSSHQRYYSTVTDVQKELEDTFNDLLYAMDVWCTLGKLSPAGTWSAVYDFDDSVITDHDIQFVQDQQATNMSVMPKYVFLMRNYGLDETTAKKWVAEVQAETPEPTSFFPGE
jgi:A118 family predicted phage portal protein